MQAALWIYNLSAVTLIMFAVSKRISQVNVVYHRGNSDQMALPHRGHSVKNINQQKKPVKQKENCIL